MTISIAIVEQGRVLVNGTKAVVYASAPNIVCAYIDLDSKNAELLHGARSNRYLCLYAGDETWPYDESKDHEIDYHVKRAKECREVATRLAETIRRLQDEYDAYTRSLNYHLGRLKEAELLTAKQREASHGSD